MPIRIDITPLFKSVGNTIKIDEEENISYPEDNLILTGPVRVTGELTNVGETILFTGRVRSKVRINCGRCLKDFDLPLDFELEEEYSRNPQRQPVRGRELKLTEKDFVFAVEPDNTIDLTEVIRQNMITELPIMPLCDRSCPEPVGKNKEDQ